MMMMIGVYYIKSLVIDVYLDSWIIIIMRKLVYCQVIQLQRVSCQVYQCC